VILRGAIYTVGDRIVDIGPSHELAQRVPPGTSVVDCTDRIIIPGLISTHSQLSQSIIRGMAEDMPLFSWLCDAIWPLEAAVQELDGYHSARLTIAEMLKSGTTCFLEAMVSHNGGIENVVKATGE